VARHGAMVLACRHLPPEPNGLFFSAPSYELARLWSRAPGRASPRRTRVEHKAPDPLAGQCRTGVVTRSVMATDPWASTKVPSRLRTDVERLPTGRNIARYNLDAFGRQARGIVADRDDDEIVWDRDRSCGGQQRRRCLEGRSVDRGCTDLVSLGGHGGQDHGPADEDLVGLSDQCRDCQDVGPSPPDCEATPTRPDGGASELGADRRRRV